MDSEQHKNFGGSIVAPETINPTTNQEKTRYLIGTSGIVILFVFTPIVIVLCLLQLSLGRVANTMPEYYAFYFWSAILFPTIWNLCLCWAASFYLLIIVKKREVILMGIGRLKILNRANVRYFEKIPTPYPGPLKHVEPETSLRYAVLVNGKKILLALISLTVTRQKRIEKALIESIGAPVYTPEF